MQRRSAMTGYVTAEEMAERWNVSARQIQMLCQNGKIEGAGFRHLRIEGSRCEPHGCLFFFVKFSKIYVVCCCMLWYNAWHGGAL